MIDMDEAISPRVITCAARWTPPPWALLQRRLMDVLDRAAVEFVERYTRPDGTLVWREQWPGMDGSDDPYEGFQNFSLFYILGGGAHVQSLARRQWEAITWQWTEYGQIYREFDGYYDWMHHGESSHLLYFQGLADPTPLIYRQRVRRFAGFYTGEDAHALNYDRERRMMRSPINGSRGPRFETTAEDWSTHRDVLDHYPPPFEDIPGVSGPLCPWTDDAVYGHILQRINERMARGDVPLNLTATSLITHAHMYTPDDGYRRWVLDYLEAWAERTQRNGGLTPDNVGLSDRIGEYNDGKWWGGYYGWRWPHGSFTIIEPLTIAGCNAALLDGGAMRHLDLARSQLDHLWRQGREQNGAWVVPHKHGDSGWTAFRPMDPLYAMYCWFISRDEQDLARVTRVLDRRPAVTAPTTRVGKGLFGNTEQWFHYIRGGNPGYPEQILRANYELVGRQIDAMRTDQGDPASWDVHHWQDRTPMVCEALVQTMLGAPMPIYHGGLLHASVRYYDAHARRAGLPPAVAALVEKLEPGAVVVTLGNLDLFAPRELIVQAGSFAEHEFTFVEALGPDGAATERTTLDGPWLRVSLAPGAGATLRLGVRRYARQASYNTPWTAQTEAVGLIVGRDGQPH